MHFPKIHLKYLADDADIGIMRAQGTTRRKDMMTTKQLDFAATQEKAQAMSDAQLIGAIHDIQNTLPSADAMDRADGTSRGGYYRDEASVYHAEIKRRAKATKLK